MIFKRWVSAIILFAFSVGVSADVFNTPKHEPENLHIYNESGHTYVDLVAHGCSGLRYWLTPEHLKYDAIFSILLAAQLSNREVVLRVDGCNGVAQGKIVGVYIP